jgi:hypothetical protein
MGHRRLRSVASALRRLLMLIAGAALVACAPAAGARPWPCLPPLFDGGQRLHEMPAPRIFWLELLLRQHELCWRDPATPGELRVALIGSSAVYGMPLPIEETFGARLNRGHARLRIPARFYNLGFVYSSQVRDAFVIHEALRYEPDVLVVALTLGEFVHRLPSRLAFFEAFFASNLAVGQQLVAEPPAGLAEPFERYGGDLAKRKPGPSLALRLRETGAALRSAARVHAGKIRARLHSPMPPPPPPPSLGRQTSYDCANTLSSNAQEFSDWKAWNILAHLEHLQRTRGIPVLVVNWPVAHEPVGDCYNVRFGNSILADYVAWLEQETRSRGLRYLDLHDRLPPEAFLDSVHVGPDGHEQVADQLDRALVPVLDEAARARRSGARSPRRAPSG